ncbi:tetratricopeptide repeat protein [Moorena sp. SIO3I8]|uniref:tetratricopeptide repeat protein n=1 Tax=Moorena sp. SIO3I8 TaxID=2607833 RepID=UPI0013BEF982|nr:tetratricopeptide repeat protein [Moorena sp. SIO3I8]NEO07520.1 tetratricopeptide repeat protein [Moorena sp. SIO3I8]
MNQQRRQQYLKLLHQLLTCPKGKEIKIINSNRELVDADLLQVMAQSAEYLTAKGQQNAADFLRRIRSKLLKGLESSETLTSAKASSEEYQQFLDEVLLATNNSKGDGEVVYQLLEENLDKLDHNFINILQTWASAKLSEAEPEIAKDIANTIWEFSTMISDFPLGNPANNREIAIAGYQTMLTFFTNHSNPEIWAAIQNNLGNAYCDRIRGNRANNLEKAIDAYQIALEVYTKSDFPEDWASTQNNLGIAYCERIRGDRADNLEIAIKAFQLALEVRTKPDFPIDWAITHYNLGNAYCERIRGDRADNLEIAIEAYQLALDVRTKPDFPEDWASTHNNLGIAYSDRIRGDRADNLEIAIAQYQLALEVYTKRDFPEEWARTLYNLGNAYSNRIVGETTDNLENAIACYENASEIFTRDYFPEDWENLQRHIAKLLIQLRN